MMNATIENDNSTENQEIKGKFVGREVYVNINTLVEEVINNENGEYSIEDIENFYPQFKEESTEAKCSQCDDVSIVDYDTGYCKTCFEDDNSPHEIMEWWAVSEWLMNKLRDKGEPIIEIGCTSIWGRCCSGQAILLDGVISEICQDLDLLK